MIGECFFKRNLQKMLVTEAKNESSKHYLESVQSGNPRKENFEKGVIHKNVSYCTDIECSED